MILEYYPMVSQDPLGLKSAVRFIRKKLSRHSDSPIPGGSGAAVAGPENAAAPDEGEIDVEAELKDQGPST